jgi:hypothetical protein
MEVRAGHLRWVITSGNPGFGGPGDTRTGSQAAMDVVAKACRVVTLTGSSPAETTTKMYDCQGRAATILADAGRS